MPHGRVFEDPNKVEEFITKLTENKGNIEAARLACSFKPSQPLIKKEMKREDSLLKERVVFVKARYDEYWRSLGWYLIKNIMITNLEHYKEQEPEERDPRRYVKDIELFAKLTGKFETGANPAQPITDKEAHERIKQFKFTSEDPDKVKEYEDFVKNLDTEEEI